MTGVIDHWSKDVEYDLDDVALRIRRRVLDMCLGRGQGYAGQGLALADVFAHLYFRVMRRNPDGSLLDRFVLSTGHSAIALFATLGELGVYEEEELRTYGQAGSRIEESPLEGTPGFEITGGSLGQGLSQAVGMALGERLRGSGAKVYCLLSDGELQEGQVWEAAMSASHHHLDNLVAIVDNNHMQADGAPAQVMEVEPVVERLAAFGFVAERIDGHDHEALRRVLPHASVAQHGPVAIVLETVPGKGVETFEHHHKVHYLRLTRDVWDEAIAELG
ncbi:MAG: Transketolase [Acidimicrobiaceae bacterium]|nr:Transketolase [Acidimicrobiaceae bacterium]